MVCLKSARLHENIFPGKNKFCVIQPHRQQYLKVLKKRFFFNVSGWVQVIFQQKTASSINGKKLNKNRFSDLLELSDHFKLS